jgi:hypothetical protein
LSYAFQDLRSDLAADWQSKYIMNYPIHRLDTQIVVHPLPAWQASLRGVFQRRPWTTGEWLVDASVSYAVTPAWECFVKTTNALNIGYEEIPDVPMPGRWLGGGIEVRLN